MELCDGVAPLCPAQGVDASVVYVNCDITRHLLSPLS